MATLYEIDERLRMLEDNFVDIETGEIIETEEEFSKLFDEIQMDLSTKIENTLCFYKNLISDVEAFKAEEKAIEKRRKVKENLAERLKSNIDRYITYQFTDEDGNVNKEKLNKYKFETPKVKVSYRKSEQVEIAENAKLPKKYLKVETITKPMKTEIKEALKNGINVNGASIVTNINMQVK